jgi:serine/threonine-protein kinase HSL1, negative regulator of Swe1 kinase
MLTGELPFDASTDAEIRDKIRFGQFKMPDNISENAQDLITKMLNYQNDSRITFKQVLKHPWF